MSKLYIMIYILIGISLISCSKLEEYQMNKKYQVGWSLDGSFATYAVMKNDSVVLETSVSFARSEIDPSMDSYFADKEGNILCYIISPTTNGPWGWGAKMHTYWLTDKPQIPDKLHLTFFDNFTEQMYQLDADLPKDEILHHLTTPYRNMNDLVPGGKKPANYSGLELAFAPNGWVVLFMNGYGNRREITSWQAKKIEVSDAIKDEFTVGTYTLWKQEGRENIYARDMKRYHPEVWNMYQSGEWVIDSNWYKMMQAKFPWKLEVVDPNGDWLQEYRIEYANTDRYDTLSDQIEKHRYELKPVPVKIKTWVFDRTNQHKYYLEFHMHPIPKWVDVDYFYPYYQDPNLTRLFKQFQSFFPDRNLATNQTPEKPENFATLKIILDKEEGKLSEVYLEKDGKRVNIDGAYHYYQSVVEPEKGGGYYPYDYGFPHYLTEPKAEDLSSPLFVIYNPDFKVPAE
mgnify:FL=1